MTRRQRLLFVVESGTDFRLVEGLAAGFDLELVCRRISGGVEVSQPLRISVPTTVGPASRVGFAVWLLRRLLGRKASPDLVLVQGYALAALVANLAGRVLGIPVTMHVCSPVELYYDCRRTAHDPAAPYSWAEAKGLRMLSAINARVGHRYVVLSRHLADLVRSHGSTRPVHIVPAYGVDLAVFAPLAENRSALRERLMLPNDRTLVFFSSRVAPEKDPYTLLLALRMLRDRGRAIRLVNRSGGYQRLRALARSLGVEELVDAADAVNPVTHLAQLYQAVDLCVQASREEGLGFSPLEALACGTPVVATAVGGLRETIIEGETGWTYPRGDADALARSIEQIVDNPAEAARRTRNGREMVRQRFDSSRAMADFEAILRGDNHRSQ